MDRETQLINVLVLFGMPVDQDAFEQGLADTHRSRLNGLPNLERVVINRIAAAAHGTSPYYAIEELYFPSEEAMQAGLNSEAGQAMARELSDFASGGYTILFAQTTSEILIPGP